MGTSTDPPAAAHQPCGDPVLLFPQFPVSSGGSPASAQPGLGGPCSLDSAAPEEPWASDPGETGKRGTQGSGAVPGGVWGHWCVSMCLWVYFWVVYMWMACLYL